MNLTNSHCQRTIFLMGDAGSMSASFLQFALQESNRNIVILTVMICSHAKIVCLCVEPSLVNS
jgi:hypothetical protein